jgi:sortase A
VELPVLAEFDGMADLDIAPCRYSGSPYTNDLVIAGHNYRSHFRPLLDVGIGDDVYLVTASKKKLRYQVVSVETLQPTAIEDMVDSSYDLSLFTCTNDSLARWTVRCMRAYD